MFVRCRHLNAHEKQTTLFRLQFETGFIKLFKLDLEGKDCDLNVEVPGAFHVVLDFTPVDLCALANALTCRAVSQAQQVQQAQQGEEMEGDLDSELAKENSPLWTEISRHRERRTLSN